MQLMTQKLHYVERLEAVITHFGVHPRTAAKYLSSAKKRLKEAVAKIGGQGSPATIASAVEFIMEGLHLNRKLNKDRMPGATRYRR